MRRNRNRVLDPVWIGCSTALAVAMMASPGWGQLPPLPAVPDAAKDVTNAAQDAVKDVTNTAKDVQKEAKDTAQETVKDVQDTAKDVQKDAKDTAKDTVKDVQDTAKDVQKDAKDTAQDTLKNAKDTAKDLQKDATNAARDATRDARDTVNDATNAARQPIDARTNVRTDTRLRTQGSASARVNGTRAADLGIWFDQSIRNGLIIADVGANTALAQVGFREGDRIVSVNGQPMTAEADFVRYLLNNNTRARMNVIVLRDGVQQTLFVEPNMISQRATITTVDPLEQLGIVLDDRTTDRLLVWRVLPRSAAFYAGIRAGDVLTSFANQQLATSQSLTQIVQQTRPGMIPIQVSRNGQVRALSVDFPDLQASAGTHTTLRQNLDAGIDAQTNVDAAAAAPRLESGRYYGTARARGVLRRRR